MLLRTARVDQEHHETVFRRQARAQVCGYAQIAPANDAIEVRTCRDDAIVVAEQHPVPAEVDHVNVVTFALRAEFLDRVDEACGGLRRAL
jgi:hypothetical protein